jgi:peptidylprolyl isomerase
MSQPPSNIPRQRLPLVLGATGVVVAGVVAIAIGVNQANTAGVVPTPTPTTAQTSTPSASASVASSATPCDSATFGTALAPLNPPADPHKYTAPPATQIDTSTLYQATIHTAKGDIVLCLEPSLAPNTVNNFVALSRNHFYDGIPFHRVVAGFVIQGGDPNCIANVSATTCGSGGPGYQFKDERVKSAYTAGCVAMANSGANTNGSQIFICSADDSRQLQPQYNLFGYVQSGMPVVLKIAKGDLMETVTVKQQQ